MELEAGARPLLMLKEWLELEYSAELSRDGFGCYPRHLAAELRSGSGSRRRSVDIMSRVSTAVKAALFPPSERELESALSGNFTRRLRAVGFWKKRRGEGEELDRRVPASCSAATSSGMRDGSSPRRQSCELTKPGGDDACGTGRQSHETEIAGCEATSKLDQEKEGEQRLSPVCVMDFLSQDEDDDEDEGGNGDGEEDGDDEIPSPTFQLGLASIRRASQQLLQKIRKFEQLAELDASDADDVTTATEDISCHDAESESMEDGEGDPVEGLLEMLEASSPGSTRCYPKLLEDFFCHGLTSSCHGQIFDRQDRAKSLLAAAMAWLDREGYYSRSDEAVEEEEIIGLLGRWRCLSEDDQELLAADLECTIFSSLVAEVIDDLS